MALPDDQIQVNDVCFTYFNRRRHEFTADRRLAYYTTAETALKIIQGKTFWLRNPQLMNDYAEVVHGRECLRQVLRDPDVLAAAATSLDSVYDDFFADLIQRWMSFVDSDRPMPYVACLSEIDLADNRGVLSMWRAYGGNNGVALVMRNELLDLDSNFLNTFHSPVLYGDVAKVKELMLEVLNGLGGLQAAVEAVGQHFLRERLLIALEFAMLSIKHVGFQEEKEWRMIHHSYPDSKHLRYRSQIVRGSAEVVCEIDLASHPSLRPGTMIEKVLVGPCTFREATAEAIAHAFVAADEPVPLIVQSDIPLRHM